MKSVYVISCIVALVLSSTAAVERKAIVTLYKAKDALGQVEFQEQTDGTVKVSGKLTGLIGRQLGFHVHEKGDISDGCNNTGDHFNPQNKSHGAPGEVERHVGDLGNIQVDSTGTADINIIDNVISLVGPHSIIGRTLVVHNSSDDLGKGASEDSKRTGNSGPKVACGVIGIQSPVTPWEKGDASSVWKSASALLLSIVVATVLM